MLTLPAAAPTKPEAFKALNLYLNWYREHADSLDDKTVTDYPAFALNEADHLKCTTIGELAEDLPWANEYKTIFMALNFTAKAFIWYLQHVNQQMRDQWEALKALPANTILEVENQHTQLLGLADSLRNLYNINTYIKTSMNQVMKAHIDSASVLDPVLPSFERTYVYKITSHLLEGHELIVSLQTAAHNKMCGTSEDESHIGLGLALQGFMTNIIVDGGVVVPNIPVERGRWLDLRLANQVEAINGTKLNMAYSGIKSSGYFNLVIENEMPVLLGHVQPFFNFTLSIEPFWSKFQTEKLLVQDEEIVAKHRFAADFAKGFINGDYCYEQPSLLCRIGIGSGMHDFEQFFKRTQILIEIAEYNHVPALYINDFKSHAGIFYAFGFKPVNFSKAEMTHLKEFVNPFVERGDFDQLAQTHYPAPDNPRQVYRFDLYKDLPKSQPGLRERAETTWARRLQVRPYLDRDKCQLPPIYGFPIRPILPSFQQLQMRQLGKPIHCDVVLRSNTVTVESLSQAPTMQAIGRANSVAELREKQCHLRVTRR